MKKKQVFLENWDKEEELRQKDMEEWKRASEKVLFFLEERFVSANTNAVWRTVCRRVYLVSVSKET